MPNWLLQLRARPEHERRIAAGAIMAVLSVFIFIAWGHSLKQSISQTAAIPLVIPDTAALEEGMNGDTLGSASSPLEKPIHITTGFFAEALLGVRALGDRAADFEVPGAVRDAFSGLGYIEAADVGGAVLGTPREWLHATTRFVSRGLAALRATNDDVLRGIGRAAGYVFE